MWKKYWIGKDRFSVGIFGQQLYSNANACQGCKTLLNGLGQVDFTHRWGIAAKTYHILFNLKGLPLRIEYGTSHQVEFFTTEGESLFPYTERPMRNT